MDVQGQLLGIQTFMFVVNSVRLLKFLISRGTVFHIFWATHVNDFKP